jgi:hypothetical protein
MHAHDCLIVAKGARRDLMAHDVVEPSIEEFRQGDTVFLQELTIVNLPPQFLELPASSTTRIFARAFHNRRNQCAQRPSIDRRTCADKSSPHDLIAAASSDSPQKNC